MAQFKNGQLVGKIGNTVAYRRNGKVFMKKAPVRTSPPTEGELKNRFILELVQGWLNPIQEYLKLGFRNFHPRYEGINAATSLLYKQGLHKNGFQSTIDPALVRVSFGPVGLPESCGVDLQGQELHFSWSTELDASKDPRDGALLLAYNVEEKAARYELCTSSRSSGGQVLTMVNMPPGTYHLYLAFMNLLANAQSENAYLGPQDLFLRDLREDLR